MACKEKNDLEPGLSFRVVASFEYCVFPEASLFHYSSSCHFCGIPACLQACPMNAITKNDEGIVLYDSSLCIACQSCVKACPHGSPKLSLKNRVVMKCNACIDLKSQNRNPACVDSCHMRCLDFGDINVLQDHYGLSSEGMKGYLGESLSTSETEPTTVIIQTRKVEGIVRQITL
ncbi:MAG: 4Fe-4S dicluster domain-containing protein [Raoultibacter sp.]